jgi:flagellar hook-length control protein FliK
LAVPQALPLGPQFPFLPDKPADAREPPAAVGDERLAGHHAFGRMVERLTRSDPPKGPVKDPGGDAASGPARSPARDPAASAPTDTAAEPDDAATDTDEPATVEADAESEKRPAPGRAAAADSPAGAPAVPQVTSIPQAAAVGVPGLAIVPPLPAPPANEPPAADASDAPSPAVAAPAMPAAAIPTDGTRWPPDAMAPEPAEADAVNAAAALPGDRAAVAIARARPMSAAMTGGAADRPATAAADKSDTLPGGLAPRANAGPAALRMAGANPAAGQEPKTRGEAPSRSTDPATAAGPTTTAAADQPQAPPAGAESAPPALAAIDPPRSVAAHYHRLNEVGARFNVEGPPPTDQLSIRILHAAAEGRRAIQVHLHPAELGAVDVKLQWQGDRLTVRFLVDLPETLQLLQRDLPALERSLDRAGVSVESGGLSFSLRQQQGSLPGSPQPFAAAPTRGSAAGGPDDGLLDAPMGQVIRDGILSIRV